MKTILSLLIIAFGSPFLFSHSLTIESSTSISIASSSSISIDGLKLAPSDTYTISGSNIISHSVTAINSGGNNSVESVFSSSATLSNFSGTLLFLLRR